MQAKKRVWSYMTLMLLLRPGVIKQHNFAYMYNLSDVVIDKPIGLCGTIHIYVNSYVIYICTIYHENERFEN